MRLSELLKDEKGPPAGLSRDVEVTGLSADSRTVRPGFVFAAIKGTQSDGQAFVGDAIDCVYPMPSCSEEVESCLAAVLDDVGLFD